MKHKSKEPLFRNVIIFINVPTQRRNVCSHFIYYIYPPYNIYILGHLQYLQPNVHRCFKFHYRKISRQTVLEAIQAVEIKAFADERFD